MISAKGIDISSWQHPNGAAIDWQRVKDAGVTFVMVKATQGVTYINPYFNGPESHDVEEAAGVGLLVGAYHFAQPGSNAPEAEAAHFLAAIADLPLVMGLWLDLEELGAMPIHEAGPWALTFLAAIASHNDVTGLYTDKSIQSMLVGVPTGGRLWLANPTPEPGDPPSYLTQTGQGTIDGIVGAVDLDTLNNVRGTNPGPVAPPAPPPPPAPVALPPVQPAPPAPPIQQEADVQVPTLSEQTPGPTVVSEATRAVQAILLGKAGIGVGPTGADGRYGNQTALAVEAYQRTHGLAVDGVCGPVTWEHLCTA